jgi:hypothetical protein
LEVAALGRGGASGGCRSLVTNDLNVMLCGDSMPSDPVIEPAALSGLGKIRLLDVRDITSFEAGHRSDAARVPIEVWEAAAKSGEASFENTGYWKTAIGALEWTARCRLSSMMMGA